MNGESEFTMVHEIVFRESLLQSKRDMREHMYSRNLEFIEGIPCMVFKGVSEAISQLCVVNCTLTADI